MKSNIFYEGETIYKPKYAGVQFYDHEQIRQKSAKDRQRPLPKEGQFIPIQEAQLDLHNAVWEFDPKLEYDDYERKRPQVIKESRNLYGNERKNEIFSGNERSRLKPREYTNENHAVARERSKNGNRLKYDMSPINSKYQPKVRSSSHKSSSDYKHVTALPRNNKIQYEEEYYHSPHKSHYHDYNEDHKYRDYEDKYESSHIPKRRYSYHDIANDDFYHMRPSYNENTLGREYDRYDYSIWSSPYKYQTLTKSTHIPPTFVQNQPIKVLPTVTSIPRIIQPTNFIAPNISNGIGLNFNNMSYNASVPVINRSFIGIGNQNVHTFQTQVTSPSNYITYQSSIQPNRLNNYQSNGQNLIKNNISSDIHYSASIQNSRLDSLFDSLKNKYDNEIDRVFTKVQQRTIQRRY